MSKGKGSSEQMIKHLEHGFISPFYNLISLNVDSITSNDVWYPKNSNEPNEVQLCTFLKNHYLKYGKSVSNSVGDQIKKWWKPNIGSEPTWDFISTCRISGEQGILLIEAKAHKDEFDESKKSLSKSASKDSNDNHVRITEAIKEAKNSIYEHNGLKLNISVDNCYQLSNRIAHAWWLANNGIPTVLVYLGFLNDPDMKNHFTDKNNWESEFINYSKNVGVDKMIGQEIKTSKASFELLSLSIDSL